MFFMCSHAPLLYYFVGPHPFCLFRPLLFLSETNLKVRQALTVTGDLGDDVEKLADFDGKFSQ